MLLDVDVKGKSATQHDKNGIIAASYNYLRTCSNTRVFMCISCYNVRDLVLHKIRPIK
jgi:hypothetical protein